MRRYTSTCVLQGFYVLQSTLEMESDLHFIFCDHSTSTSVQWQCVNVLCVPECFLFQVAQAIHKSLPGFLNISTSFFHLTVAQMWLQGSCSNFQYWAKKIFCRIIAWRVKRIRNWKHYMKGKPGTTYLRKVGIWWVYMLDRIYHIIYIYTIYKKIGLEKSDWEFLFSCSCNVKGMLPY